MSLKRFVSILIIAVLLLSSSEFDQLVKLPALVDHYLEHRSEDKSISFVQFIVLHYKSDSKHKESKHHDLPFKSHECHNISHLLVLDDLKDAEPIQIGFSPEPHSAYTTDFYNSEKVSSIWQPPQA